MHARHTRFACWGGTTVFMVLSISIAVVASWAADRPLEEGIRRAEDLMRDGLRDRAISLLDSLSRVARRSPSLESSTMVDVLRAQVLTLSGDRSAAIPLARHAAALAEAQRDSLTLSRALRWLAASLSFEGRLSEASPHWERLLAVATARGDVEHEGFARLGLAYEASMNGRLAEARSDYRRSIGLFRRAGRAYWEAWALTALGHLEQVAGNLSAARASHVEAAAVSHRGRVVEYEAHAANNIAALDYLQGDPGSALDGFRAARRILHDIGGHEGAITASQNEAICLRDLGRYDEAYAVMDSLLRETRDRAYVRLEGSLLAELGELRRLQRRLGDSARLLRQGLRLKGAEDTDRIEAAISLAVTLEARDSAATGIEQLDGLSRSLWPRLAPEARADTDHVIGRWLCRVGRPLEALTRLRRADRTAAGAGYGRLRIGPLTWMAACERQLGHNDSARAHLDRAATVWEAERAHVHDPEWRERYGSLVKDLMFEQARSHLTSAANTPSESDVEAAFDAVQRFKSRTLRERMLGPEGSARHAGNAPDVGLHELRQLLGPHDLYLEFIEGPDGIVWIAVTRELAKGAVLEFGQSGLGERLGRLTRLLRTPPGTGDPSAAIDEGAAALELGRELLAPVADMIAGARRVIVAPDGVLCRLPLACLGVPGGAPGETSRMMIEGAEVAWVPSASVLADLRRRRSAPSGRLLAIQGAPVTGRQLPGSVAETRWLANTFEGAGLRSATSRVDAADFEKYMVLHFASHSDVDDQHPWRSGIHLASSDDSLDDGWLRAEEIAPSKLDARLVVLAACESAGGPVISGDGVIGLTGAFLSGGAPTVVASLWPVDDRATERLMRTFYLALERGLTACTALREAQLELRDSPGTRHPFYWAGFVLVGDPETTVPLRRRNRSLGTLAMVAGVGVAVFLAGAAIGRIRRTARPRVTSAQDPPLTP